VAENDPDKLKGPGGLTLRQIHERVKESVTRDREARKLKNQLAQKPNRWQRFVRYVWDRNAASSGAAGSPFPATYHRVP
jgi:hypothetical protein